MKDMYIRKLFFQLEKPSAASREAVVLHDREERGYSSNHHNYDPGFMTDDC